MKKLIYVIIIVLLFSCTQKELQQIQRFEALSYTKNILNYKIIPKHKFDKDGLMFSDQGAWFAYSFPDSTNLTGFTGPFLLTQQNGIWASKALTELSITDIEWKSHKTASYNSHLEQIFTSDALQLTQQLIFASGHTAHIQSEIKNTSSRTISIKYQWKNKPVFADSLNLKAEGNSIKITSVKTPAIGYLQFFDIVENCQNNSYNTEPRTITLQPEEVIKLQTSQSFIFPEYSWKNELKKIKNTNFDSLLIQRKIEKDQQLQALFTNAKSQFEDTIYKETLAKAHLTLQNNWRIPAGEIKHDGLFPSYHYKWFNGFWSWDSWKHSVGLSFYNTDLAKKQIKLMFEFQNNDGFVADVVYRDTTIEAHNYRDTKPPLSAWAVTKVFEKDNDLEFIKYMYPKLKKYHYWWYNKRDHDKDGICEYGSTDGSLIAAKWESGMDNAIRFDNSKIVKNNEGAYSLYQESVDLNAYLYAEKLYLAQLAKALESADAATYLKEAKALKHIIQTQFFSIEDGWFYDTSLDGKTFIKGEGSEGWTALWAKVATQDQAEKVKNRMMNPNKFYTKVPFQTMSADHEKFAPLKGYWRGPNWLDQAYFGVKGLRNYGFNDEANKATIQILKGAEGLLEKGKPIRENYHPISGQGLHAKNFSWSAAHVIMLLVED
ncbi:trehalase family glycosidase [Aquimarina sp. AU474]|uniref:MGH1-like glycoside hydrolase domain-containing protein n=1 Tax=Aquimarina sp. AU474 TaxID=2108529 RepID=UPI000D690D12|nr:trehalase family glycosidase [Aquimarina sp. AU474]